MSPRGTYTGKREVAVMLCSVMYSQALSVVLGRTKKNGSNDHALSNDSEQSVERDMSRSNSARAHLEWLFIGSSQNNYFLKPGGGGNFPKKLCCLVSGRV